MSGKIYLHPRADILEQINLPLRADSLEQVKEHLINKELTKVCILGPEIVQLVVAYKNEKGDFFYQIENTLVREDLHIK